MATPLRMVSAMPPAEPGVRIRSGRRARPSRRAALLACVCLAAAVLAIVSPRSAAAQTSGLDGAEIAAIEFVGNTIFDPAALRSAIVTRPTECRLLPPLAPVCWAGFALNRHYLDERILPFDVDRLLIFYSQRGYRYARVEARVEAIDGEVSGADDDVPAAGGDPDSGPRVRVIFEVDAGEPVRISSFTINWLEEIDDPSVTRSLPLSVGGRLDQIVYEATRDTLLSRLRNRGYAHAEVLGSFGIDAGSPLAAEIELDVLPGPLARIGEIDVVGTDVISPDVVRRMLTFESGDVYRSAELIRSQRNLFGLEVFRHAAIVEGLGDPTDTIIPIRVEVSEGDLHRMRVGSGLSTAECINAEGRWTSRNFLGGARRVEVHGRLANILAGPLGGFPCLDTGSGEYGKLTGWAGVDFTQPWLFSPANTFRAGLFVERRSLPNIFVRTAAGGYISLTHSLRQGSVTAGYQPELTKLDAADLIFCVSFVVCEPADIQVLQSARRLAPLTISAVRDRSNSVFAPTSGDVVRLEAEFASRLSGSEFSYLRVIGDASIYHQVAQGVVLAGRLRSGWSKAISEPTGEASLGVHPQKRFFGGGSNSVRGFAQSRLGPKVLTVDAARVLLADTSAHGAGCTEAEVNDGSCDASGVDFGAPRPVGGAALFEGNVEVRFPFLTSNLAGAAFLDFGQVWRAADDVDLTELAWTPGVGLRYFSPIGPVRVDVGYNPTGAERLPVITTEVENGLNTDRLRTLSEPVLWNPRERFLDRLQLHISIGQAF